MNNHAAFAEACTYFPGGVNSPVRAFKSVNSEPFIVAKANGAYLYDLEGKAYIDFINSWGPLVLGHSHPSVVQALTEQLSKGTSFGCCSRLEVELASIIKKFFPSMELLRFVNSGTEAGMAVIRLARAFTKRKKIVKFAGCYHGHSDALLVAAGSGAATCGIPGSAGVSAEIVANTLTLNFNSITELEELFTTSGDEIAAVIIEPVVGNAGFIKPLPGYLEALRAICTKHESLLIFDEVMTGFRVALTGAQGYFNIKPDLTMLGKVIGGGLPVGAFGGRKDVMEMLAPLGAVYQAGTLSGNPLAMTAGIATLKIWTDSQVFEKVTKITTEFVGSLSAQASKLHDFQADSLGTMFGFFFNKQKVHNYEQAKLSDQQKFVKYFQAALSRGVFFAPSQYEAGFISLAHDSSVIEKTLDITDSVFKMI